MSVPDSYFISQAREVEKVARFYSRYFHSKSERTDMIRGDLCEELAQDIASFLEMIQGHELPIQEDETS